MSLRTVPCWVAAFLAVVSGGATLAGEGVVALQTADPACPDDSGKVYVNCNNGTVTDNRTGLVWLKNASCLLGTVDFDTAMEFVAGLSDIPGTSPHDCGLSDGSSPGEWRLPSVKEWEAMVADALGQDLTDPDCTASPPTITNDSGLGCCVSGPCAFTGVQSDYYWAANTSYSEPEKAWCVTLAFGLGGFVCPKVHNLVYVWPVCGGQ